MRQGTNHKQQFFLHSVDHIRAVYPYVEELESGLDLPIILLLCNPLVDERNLHYPSRRRDKVLPLLVYKLLCHNSDSCQGERDVVLRGRGRGRGRIGGKRKNRVRRESNRFRRVTSKKSCKGREVGRERSP